MPVGDTVARRAVVRAAIMPEYLVPFGLGLILSLALTPLSRLLAVRIGAIDHPDARRIHVTATPRLGGPAIFFALALSIVLTSSIVGGAMSSADRTRLLWAGIAALIITLIGGTDDIRALRPATKLAVEAVAASLAVHGGFRLDLPPLYHLDLLAFPLSTFFIISIINAVNLVDGLDGLAVGLCLIIGATLFLLCDSSGSQAVLTVASCGVMLGFLCYNFHPARIFLGDSGALLLGFVVAISALAASHREGGRFPNAAPLLVLGLPLAEATVTVMRRLLRVFRMEEDGEDASHYRLRILARPALFSADRDHFHHRILTLGFSHRGAVLMFYLIGAAICAATLAPPSRLAALAMIVAAVIGVRTLGYRELMPIRGGLLLPMLQAWVQSNALIWMIADLTAVLTSYLLAALIRWGPGDASAHFSFIAMSLLVGTQIAMFALHGLYRRAWHQVGLEDVIAVIRAVVAAAALGGALGLLAPALNLNPAVIVLDAYLSATMVLGARLSFRVAENLYQRERRGRRRVLIYGTGRMGIAALNEIRSREVLKMSAVGFLEDNPSLAGIRLRGLPIHPSSALPHLIAEGAFDQLAIANRTITAAHMRRLVEQCERAGLEVTRFASDFSAAPAGREIFRSPASFPTADEDEPATAHLHR